MGPKKNKQNTDLTCANKDCMNYTEYCSQLSNIVDIFGLRKSISVTNNELTEEEKKSIKAAYNKKKEKIFTDKKTQIEYTLKLPICRQMKHFLNLYSDDDKDILRDGCRSIINSKLYKERIVNFVDSDVVFTQVTPSAEELKSIFVKDDVFGYYYKDLEYDGYQGYKAIENQLEQCSKKYCRNHTTLFEGEDKFFEQFENWLNLHNGDDHSKRVCRVIKQLMKDHGLLLETFLNEQDLLVYTQNLVRTQSQTLSVLYPIELEHTEKRYADKENENDDDGVNSKTASNSLLSSNTVYKFVNALRLCSLFLNFKYDELELYSKQLSTRLKNYEEGVHLVILYDFNTTYNILNHIIHCMDIVGKELIFSVNFYGKKITPEVPFYAYGHIGELKTSNNVRNTYVNLLLNLFICPVSKIDDWKIVIEEQKNNAYILAQIGNRFSDNCSDVKYEVDPKYIPLMKLLHDNFVIGITERKLNTNTRHLTNIRTYNNYHLLGIRDDVVHFLKNYVHTLYAAFHTYKNSEGKDFFNIKRFSRYLTMAKVGMATSQYSSHYRGLESAEELEKALKKFQNDLHIESPNMKAEIDSVDLNRNYILRELRENTGEEKT